MPKFEWNEATYAVGVPKIDDEHRQIFRLASDLERAIMAGAPASEIQPLVEDLVIHAAKHFSYEERAMRQSRYRLYAWHQQRHNLARARIKALERSIRCGDRDPAIELLDFLFAWLSDHARLADRMLAAHLRNYQRELMARAS